MLAKKGTRKTIRTTATFMAALAIALFGAFPGYAALAPTDIALSSNTVDENQDASTEVGTFTTTDPDAGDIHTYSLVAGTGATDNASFQISGDTLQTSAMFDFENEAHTSSYLIRVRTTDNSQGFLWYEEEFTITVTDVNDDPTDITLSVDDVAENQASGTEVGTFTTTDQDVGDSHTYSLVAGTGATDNTSFQISGDKLQTNAIFDYETKSSYSIRVQTMDSGTGNLTYEKQFTITVTDINDAPVANVDSDTTSEDTPVTTNVVTNDTDVDGTVVASTVAIVSGPSNGDAVNNGNGTVTYTPDADFNGSDTYTYTAKDNDGATSNEAEVTITVDPVNDEPSFTKGANQTVNEDAGAQTVNGWATGISAGPTDESGQSLAFQVSNNNNGLFAVQPTISATGDLTYTPADDANDSATVTVSLQDDGGTPNGGVDTSASQSFTITCDAVNDVPSFIKGANQTVNEDAGAQTVNGWATGISA
ncbi:MAG: Ig-like domain-containing protein, partial [Candidatus Bipolaricaulota bacterium]